MADKKEKHIGYKAGDYFVNKELAKNVRWVETYEGALPDELCDELYNKYVHRTDSEEDVWWVDDKTWESLFNVVADTLTASYGILNPWLQGLELDRKEWIVAKYPVGSELPIHSSRIATQSISILFFLNDDFEGGYLDFPVQRQAIKPKKGTMVIFPSTCFYPHEVTKVLSGNTRMTLIGGFTFKEGQK